MHYCPRCGERVGELISLEIIGRKGKVCRACFRELQSPSHA